ncbi:MAG: hypothetical protein RL755_1989 [Pseudomonadota bacterium]
MMKKIRFIFLSTVLASTLVACGQTGALVLPSKTPTSVVHP